MQNKNILHTLGVITFLVFVYAFFINSPSNFPVGSLVRVEEGSSLRSVSLQLKEANIIRSRLVFEALVILFGRERGVISTDYYFGNKLSVFEVARRISKGEHHLAPIVVTIPEGFTIAEISNTFASKLIYFNKNNFTRGAEGLEGYLFPDTYYFLRNDNETSVLSSMRENFNKKIAILRSDIVLFKKSERDIIIMASLIEGEARGDADREFISGILWKRISINMPLQVDVAPVTYKAKGLPNSPIGNPGIEAIKAAIYPKSSFYLYYLHDKNGAIHYARTFAEHQTNIRKYLTRTQ